MIKNIIFDVGKVLVSYEPETFMAEKLGFDTKTREALNEAMLENPLWNESDRGAVPAEEMLKKFIANRPDYEAEIRKAYLNVGETIELMPYAVEWVKGLKERGYHLYILSNYAGMTYEQTSHKMKFLPYMDGVLFSFQCKLIKPEKEIYQHLLEKYSLNPEECVFLDDRKDNIEAAEKCGIRGIQFFHYDQAVKDLDSVLRDRKEHAVRTVHVDEITKAVSEMCIGINYVLSEDMSSAIKSAAEQEESPLGKQILSQLQENLEIAEADRIPVCQDTGMAVVFLEIGQDVHLEGGLLEDAVNEGVRQGYARGYLRKSVVGDPIIRENTGDNTPAVIHCRITGGDRIRIKVAPKGFGSENMSRVFMLKPADGIEGVKEAVLGAVREAGPNACPPMVIGVGIGGTFEKCALMAKEALTREVGSHSPVPYIKELEEELLEKINKMGIGPGGLGGTTTALGVNILTYPTHIAGLPVAVNICCHVNRHAVREL